MLLALVYLPRAEIILHPAAREHTAEQPIVLSRAAAAPDFVRYILPARLITVSATDEQTIVREGAASVDDFAKGEVNFVNSRDEEQQLLPKTHLKHEATGTFFLTDFPVAIPAKGSVRMTVTAKEKGAGGNVSPGRFLIDKLPEELKSDVYAESVVAFTGGVAVENALAEEEIARAKEAVFTAAQEKARAELSTQAGGVPLSPELMTFHASEEHVSAAAGSRTQSFTVRTTVEGQAFVVDENDLLSLTLLALRSGGSSEEEFVSYRPESFRVKIAQADFERGEARVIGTLSGLYASKVGPTLLDPAPLAGLSPEEVKAHLKDNQAVGDVEVALSPFWVRTVPGRAGAAAITVK